MIDKGIIVIPGQMLILSEYPNNKNTFYKIYEHHCFVRKYKCVGLCPTQNKDKSVSLTVFRNEVNKIKYNYSGNIKCLTYRRKQWQGQK